MFEKAKYCAIHPAIGIARVGNSPRAYFVGPEVPGRPAVPPGGYKDSGDPEQGVPPRVKRQGARFRIYAYDDNDEPIRDEEGELIEVTAAHAEIAWRVHLANTKAEWDRFAGTRGEELPLGQRRDPVYRRNTAIEDRKSLIIDPGPRIVTGSNKTASFDGGTFRGIEVPLGDLRTDEEGRLIVLGGFGRSGTSNQKVKITDFANNDFWYDDVSDGPVSARVTFREDGREIKVKPSWVIVAPPDFAPAVVSIVTLYDVVLDVAVRRRLRSRRFRLSAPSAEPSFTQDIYPIFARLNALKWVQETTSADNANGLTSDLAKVELLASNDPKHRGFRTRIFDRIRDPRLNPDSSEAEKQPTAEYIPALYGDGGPGTWLTLTKTQYSTLAKWRRGKFRADRNGEPGSSREPDPSKPIPPEDLDRAALEGCTGGAFYPGMEVGWVLRNPRVYERGEPFRLSHKNLEPGDLTKRMACPWQADFFECRLNWWPTHRPDDVLTDETYYRTLDLKDRLNDADLEPGSADEQMIKLELDGLLQSRVPWARGLPAELPDGGMEMVDRWYQHGFVVDRTHGGGAFLVDKVPQFIETERGKYDGLGWPEYFHILTNIEQYPDFIPKAKELAHKFFTQANYDAHANYTRFTYSPEAFDRRMRKIYEELEKDIDKQMRWDSGIVRYPVVVRREGDEEITKDKAFVFEPEGKGFPFSDRAAIEHLRQMAPFNLVDGAWLQRVQPAGPGEEYKAHLFAIWDDEAGNGRVEQNHANVYDALLRSLNIYMPPITTREFIQQDLLPSAYTQAVFQLCVSLFPETFFPEILGMTLYLEWEATPTLTPQVRHLKARGIDPSFFELHVAIDNIDAGHGALAKEAITLYLRKKEDEGVDVQWLWERVWRGYVTWATAGKLGRDLIKRCLIIDRKQIDLSYPMMLVSNMIKGPKGLVEKLKTAQDQASKPPDKVSEYLLDQFKPRTRELIQDYKPGEPVDEPLLNALVDDLNLIIQERDICDPNDHERFADILDKVNQETGRLWQLLLSNPNNEETEVEKVEKEEAKVRLNRLLLVDAYPGMIDKIPELEPILFPDYKRYYREKMIELVRKKAPIARRLHKDKKVGRNDLARLFDDPGKLLSALRMDGFIDEQNPRNSKFLRLTEFTGPMYEVFTEEEKSIILDWIESLRDEPEEHPIPRDRKERAAEDVRNWIANYARDGADVDGHRGLVFPDERGNPKSLNEWLDDPPGLMAAFKGEPGWVNSGASAESKLYEEFSTGRMSWVPKEVADMFKEWIDTGAHVPGDEVPDEPPARRPTSERIDSVATPVVPVDVQNAALRPGRAGFAERRKLIGMGSVH